MAEASSVTDFPPYLSVVMPVRNGADYLELAAQSVLRQTFGDFEFIIIDDGSVDRSPALLADLAAWDRRIRLLRTTGEGIVAALNLGFGAARGRMVARMDADDIAFPERFSAQIEALQKRPRLVALGGGAVTIDASGKETGQMKVTEDGPAAVAELMSRNSFLHPTMMLDRAAVLAAGLYRPACIYAEDYDLWLRLSEGGEMANLAQPLIRFRIHAQQTSRTRRLMQRAATAFARQLALRRRAGQAEGIDMTQPLHTALADFLRQRAESPGPLSQPERKDLEMMLREIYGELDSATAQTILRLLRPGSTLWGSLQLRLRLALARGSMARRTQ